MVLRFFFALAAAALLLCCSQFEFDNPYDPDNWPDDWKSSSSSRQSSSSSVTVPSSSSAAPSSSSSSRPSSSSSVPPSSSSRPPITYGSVTYGSQAYKTVQIGVQNWMAENLNYNPGTGNSGCYDCSTYGRLYDWATAMALPSYCNSSTCASQVSAKHQGICPSGWHIPSDDDWETLISYVGGSSVAGKHLKSVTGWNSYSGIVNEDSYGFAALPGGIGGPGGGFGDAGNGGYWWSASENGSYNAYTRDMYYYSESASWYYYYGKSNRYSVRCLQD